MVIVIDGLDAATLARLRAPADLPPGTGFQPITMEVALDEAEGFRLTATLLLSDDAASDAAAHWLWERVGEEGPRIFDVGGTRARVGEAAALTWLIDRARAAT